MTNLLLALSPIVSSICGLISIFFFACQLMSSAKKTIYLCFPNLSMIIVSSSTQNNYLFSNDEIYYKLVPKKDTEIIYGRSRTAQIRAAQGQAATSSQHFRIYWNNKCWMIEDLNSTNGTYLNGIALAKGKPSKIKIGDTIHAGTADIILKKKPSRFCI